MTALAVACALLASLLLVAAEGGAEAARPPLRVVATTNIVADLVKNVVGDAGEVISLMGPGVDPHLYKASQGDIRRLSEADVIFYNGLHLEGKMGDILLRMARRTPTFAVTEYLDDADLLEPEAFNGLYDPHVWFDVGLWIRAVERVRDALIEVDPDRAEGYAGRASEYIKTLEELDAYATRAIESIPSERRTLVTAHDAFNYFGRAYGLEVRGLQGISTESEFGLADVTALVDLLVERKIGAVFIESSVSPRGLQAVIEGARAKGHIVEVGGELFSDALGPEGSPAGTYVGMLRHNVDTIVTALK